jgi:hypothetical protein
VSDWVIAIPSPPKTPVSNVCFNQLYWKAVLSQCKNLRESLAATPREPLPIKRRASELAEARLSDL